MSTNARIFLKIRKEDQGKVMKCNIGKLPNPLNENNYPCEEYTLPKDSEDYYLGIYVHNDGYEDGVGNELLEKFTTYEDVLNLILLGGCSCIWDEIISYKNWRNEELRITQTYEPCAPEYQYLYVFEDDHWRHDFVED